MLRSVVFEKEIRHEDYENKGSFLPKSGGGWPLVRGRAVNFRKLRPAVSPLALFVALTSLAACGGGGGSVFNVSIPPPQTCTSPNGCEVTEADGDSYYVPANAPVPVDATHIRNKSAPGVEANDFGTHEPETTTEAENISTGVSYRIPPPGSTSTPPDYDIDNDQYWEYGQQLGLRTIRAEHALALDATGAGVTVGIAAGGFDHTHFDLTKARFHDRSILAYPVDPADTSLPTDPDAYIEMTAGQSHKDLIEKYLCRTNWGTSNTARIANFMQNCQSDKTHIRQADPDNPGEYLKVWRIPELYFLSLLGNTFYGTAIAGVIAAQYQTKGNMGATRTSNTVVGIAPDAQILGLAVDYTNSPRPYTSTPQNADYAPTDLTTLDLDADSPLVKDIEFLAHNSQVIQHTFTYVVGAIDLYTEDEVRTAFADVITAADTPIADGELRAGEKALYVWSAGEERDDQGNPAHATPGTVDDSSHPAVLAGLPYHIDELRGRWLAATAVTAGSDLTISRYRRHAPIDPSTAEIMDSANRCGTLPNGWIENRDDPGYAGRHYCLAAPGSSKRAGIGIKIVVAGLDTERFSLDLAGVDFAAAHVSGALAVLIEHFPTLSLEEVLIRLVDSADNTDYSGNGGTDFSDAAIYGAGLLNMQAALRPLGQMQAALGNSVRGVSLPLAGSHLTAGAAYGDALSLALVGRSMTGFDDYHTPFLLSLPGLVTTPRALSLEGRHDRLAAFSLETAHSEDGTVHHIGQHGMAAILPLDEGESMTG
ncbi:MAG: S8 family serine peptidase, partial [Parvularculales bacterium]